MYVKYLSVCFISLSLYLLNWFACYVYLFNDATCSADYTSTNSRMLNGTWLESGEDLLQNRSRNLAGESEEDHGMPSVKTAWSLPWLKPGTSQMQLTIITAYTNPLANFYMFLRVVMKSNVSLRMKNTKEEREIWTSKIRSNKDWRKLCNVELHNFRISRVI